MDELKYIKGLVREYFDLREAYACVKCPPDTERMLMHDRYNEVTQELKELSGFNKDE